MRETPQRRDVSERRVASGAIGGVAAKKVSQRADVPTGSRLLRARVQLLQFQLIDSAQLGLQNGIRRIELS